MYNHSHRGAACCWLIISIMYYVIWFLIIFKFAPPHWLDSLLLLPGIVPLTVYEHFTKEKRNAVRYVDANGNLDLSTPRAYRAKDIPIFTRILGSPWIFSRNYLRSFAYRAGMVTLESWKGEKIVAPLQRLSIEIYDATKGKEDTVYIAKYGNIKFKFFHNSNLYEDAEIEDMINIMQLAGNFSVSKMGKLTNALSILHLGKVFRQSLPETATNVAISAISKLSDRIKDENAPQPEPSEIELGNDEIQKQKSNEDDVGDLWLFQNVMIYAGGTMAIFRFSEFPWYYNLLLSLLIVPLMMFGLDPLYKLITRCSISFSLMKWLCILTAAAFIYEINLLYF